MSGELPHCVGAPPLTERSSCVPFYEAHRWGASGGRIQRWTGQSHSVQLCCSQASRSRLGGLRKVVRGRIEEGLIRFGGNC